MQRSLLKRVERLEKNPRFQPPPPPSPADRLFLEKAQELTRKIDERYGRLVAEVLQSNFHEPSPARGLAFEFLMRVREHVREGRPLAFPAVVAEVYLSNPYAGNGVSCQQCRFTLPLGYFKLCPVCGGQVGS